MNSSDELIKFLMNIQKYDFNRLTIVEEKYQYEIIPAGYGSYDCKVYDGVNYKDTTFRNIITCVKEIGFEKVILE